MPCLSKCFIKFFVFLKLSSQDLPALKYSYLVFSPFSSYLFNESHIPKLHHLI